MKSCYTAMCITNNDTRKYQRWNLNVLLILSQWYSHVMLLWYTHVCFVWWQVLTIQPMKPHPYISTSYVLQLYSCVLPFPDGGMTQGFVALVPLVEDLGLISNIHMVIDNYLWLQFQGTHHLLLVSFRFRHTRNAYTYNQAKYLLDIQ